MRPTIRDESAEDAAAFADLITAAFRDAPHAGGDEDAIVDALRRTEGLSLSLVAIAARGEIVGHLGA